ncbi:hypothetical protein PYW08_013914 [Mythimna loreyi]|uniref:Uncharacterized protein n=1 Tax=Mythimna loreyi TaxID=667449 RepID=A0ACC2R8P5_9NEOP|nr:hypothetical protein PYW08_013914 [Mythimna loreyi]
MASRMVRKVLDITLAAARSAQSFGATSWKYLKVEAVPPLTVGVFGGPIGKKMEMYAAKFTNKFINAIDGRIKEIDAEAERERQEMLAAIRAHENKLLAEAKAKEAARIKEIARKAAEAVKAAKELADKKKAELAAAKPKEDPKAKAKKTKPKGKGRKKQQKRRRK